eukprot:TRINITY_DN4599_c1_g1_i1.p2 TRINITY_DN4599_c1_g1~~TRINITY_DN4599_c1_g1_i1.p2  ORF type:complete len:362 (+),score=102.60 TRINITY_DN4599_c1_g1_i1:104-1189(+)
MALRPASRRAIQLLVAFSLCSLFLLGSHFHGHWFWEHLPGVRSAAADPGPRPPPRQGAGGGEGREGAGGAAEERHEPAMRGVVNQPEELLGRLCEAFGAERCAELKAIGSWPPFEADFDVTARLPLKDWNHSAVQLFNYSVHERAPTYGVDPVFTLSERPRIEYFPHFLSDAESQRIISIAEPLLGPSGVGVGPQQSSGKRRGRTSDGCRLPRGDNPDGHFVKAIERRIHNVSGFLGKYAERLYVLRYRPTQLYHRHHDSSALVPRAATFFAWLSDMPAAEGGGGWTSWPLANGRLRGAECEQGLRVRPVRGAAALFYDMRPDGSIDHYAVHAGCPPTGNATKWAMTKWMQVRPPKRAKGG